LWNNISVAGLYCVGLLQLISVVYLLYAILKIRNHLSLQSPKQLNIKMLVINLLAFSLYLVSLIVYYVFYLILYSEAVPSPQQINHVFISWIVSAACSTVAQLCLCAICWQISKVPSADLAVQHDSKSSKTISVEDSKEDQGTHQSEPVAVEEIGEDDAEQEL
jgi:hypothetical protein